MKSNGKAMSRRPIEREYLATLNTAVPLETWQAICARAAEDALPGSLEPTAHFLRLLTGRPQFDFSHERSSSLTW